LRPLHVAQKIATWFDWTSPYLPIVSFAFTFLIIIAFVFLVAKMIQKMVEGVALSAVNKVGGAIFGALKFALMMSVVIFMIDAIEESYPMVSFKTKEESLLYRPVGKIAPTLIPALNKSKVAAMLPKAEDVKVEIEVDPASLLDTAKVKVKVKVKE
jgi:membrane protein required for colicin V production